MFSGWNIDIYTVFGSGLKNVRKYQTNHIMEYINRIEIRGKVGKVDITTVGRYRCSRMSVMTNYLFNDLAGNNLTETTWFTVTAWDDNPQVKDAFEAGEGDAIHIIGRVRINRYVAPDGSERTAVEVIAQSVKIVREG